MNCHRDAGEPFVVRAEEAQNLACHRLFAFTVLEVDLDPHVIPLCLALKRVLFVPEPVQFCCNGQGIDLTCSLIAFSLCTDLAAKGIVMGRYARIWLVYVDA